MAAAALTFVMSHPAVAQESAGNLYPGVISYIVARAGTIPAGAPTHGLAAALDTSSSTVRAGQPIVLSLEVRNTSKQMQWLYRPNIPCTYSFTVTNLRSGRSTTVAPSDCGDLYGSPVDGLSPGESLFLKFRFSEEAIAKPAHYRISLSSCTWYPKLDVAPPHTLKIASTAVNVDVMP